MRVRLFKKENNKMKGKPAEEKRMNQYEQKNRKRMRGGEREA
jgi:hypothetical protein